MNKIIELIEQNDCLTPRLAVEKLESTGVTPEAASEMLIEALRERQIFVDEFSYHLKLQPT